jgi:hypothetical protein
MKKFLLPLILLPVLLSEISLWSQSTPDTMKSDLQEKGDTLASTNDSVLTPVMKPFECRIFPTEVKSHLQVILPMGEDFTLRLVDENGNILFSHYQIFGENQVNLDHLRAAKYFVEISSSRGKIVEEITKT